MLILFGWLQFLMLENHRLQAEWIQLWQQTFLKQSIYLHNVTIPEVSICDQPAVEDVLVIRGEKYEGWVYQCKEQLMVKIF